MNLDQLKKACGVYYDHTETMETGNGNVIYKTVQTKGIKLLPLGYFLTELSAVQGLYDYLINKGLIKNEDITGQ